jgi:hypothetical protein
MLDALVAVARSELRREVEGREQAPGEHGALAGWQVLDGDEEGELTSDG